ncbi:hypothetical protein Mapa_010410 [Marchantia paleacea]|nr:hypothetical protein Mapa_010410 [Marchantia paleacea]
MIFCEVRRWSFDCDLGQIQDYVREWTVVVEEEAFLISFASGMWECIWAGRTHARERWKMSPQSTHKTTALEKASNAPNQASKHESRVK